jgi:hypothetical protein
MFNSIKFYHIIIIALIFITLLGIGFFLTNKSGPKLDVSDNKENLQGQIDISGKREMWSSRIDEIGGVPAYEQLKNAYQSLDIRKQHTLAHIFGELLYEKIGTEGVAICDDTFEFGCYHAIFSSAIIQEGTDIISQLDRACIKTWGNTWFVCQHGIGHGILSFLGPNRLNEALDMCSTLTQIKFGGCVSGVFMEYNFPVVDASNFNFDPRPLESGDIYEPCSTIPEQFRENCYFTQPQWWIRIFPDDYAKVGTLCYALDNQSLQDMCFYGTGYYGLLRSKYKYDEAYEYCKEMPIDSTTATCMRGVSDAYDLHGNTIR